MPPVWPGPNDHAAYSAPIKYLPPQSESAFLEEVIAKRRDSGLAVDTQSVRRAIENSQRPDYPLPGLFYTPEEVAESRAVDHSLGERAEALTINAGAAVGVVTWGWLDGRRVVIVPVKDDVAHYQQLLLARLGSDRVIVTTAERSEQELRGLCDRIREDMSSLADVGIELSRWGIGDDWVGLYYFAADRATAEQALRERYPPEVRPNWIGPASMAEEPEPFGSWLSDGTRFTVFYGLPRNGERPGSCTAQEHSDRVVVTLTILAPQGYRKQIGGDTPSHATVELKTPVGTRAVIDADHDLPRPEWTGAPPDA